MRNILAIRFARLGDVVLLLPALSDMKASLPGVRLTLLTGTPCAPVARLCPAIDEVIALDRVAMRDGPIRRALRDVKDLVSDIRSRQFDAVIDFHSFRETNLLTWFSRAPIRIGMRRHNAAFLPFCFNQPAILEDKGLHVSEMFRAVAKAVPGVRPHSGKDPVLQLTESVASKQQELALYIAAPVADRIWPPENFAALADHAIECLGAKPVVLSSPACADLADRLCKSSRHAGALRVFTDLSLEQLAATIQKARLLVSNDTGPMHLGPALGVRTLGLFSVGLPEHFAPMGREDHFLKAQPIEDLSVESVIREVDRMWV